MNYPVKILKKQFRSPNHVPRIIDNVKGKIHVARPEPEQKATMKHRVITGVTSTIAAVALYSIVIGPISETTLARAEVSQVVETVDSTDAQIINDLRSDYELVSEFSDSGVVSITIKGTQEQMHEALGKSLTLATVKEVVTDGKALQVKFTSAP